MSTRTVTRRVVLLSCVQTALALGVTHVAGGLAPAATGTVGVGLLVLVVAFTAAELATADIPIGDQSVSISIHELVAAVALLFASPAVFVLSRALGGLWGQLRARRHPTRIAFNLTMFALEAATAVLAFRLLARGATEIASPRVWLASVAALLLGQVVAALAISRALRAAGDDTPLRTVGDSIGRLAPFLVASAVVGTALAQLVAANPSTVWLAGAVAVAWWGLLATLEALGRRHGTLVAFHEHAARLQAVTDLDGAVQETQRAIHELLGAEHAEVHLVDPSRTVATRRAELRGWDPVSVVPLRSSPPTATDLADRHVERGLVEPLRDVDGDQIGYVLAGWSRSPRRRSTQQRTLATVARQTEAMVSRLHVTATLHDELEEKHRRSLHDRLTELPNRTNFVATVDAALAADDGRDPFVLVLELSGCRAINETLGHEAGDVVLAAAAARLVRAVRSADVVARLDGPRFAILSRGDGSHAAALAGRVREKLSRPFGHAGMELQITVRVGIAHPEPGCDAQTMVRRADTALTRAAELGLPVETYRPGDDVATMRRLRLAADLRPALDRGEVVAHFQPKIAAGSGRLSGLEALARWEHPELGTVPPNDFIPLAERTGAIGALTREVLDQALATVVTLRETHAAVPVSVNVPPLLLRPDDFDLVDCVRTLLEHHRVPPSSLLLELTESTTVQDGASMETLDRVRALGVGISIDDYGTGYSSLAYLHRLGASELKIDRAFVHDLATSTSSAVIVRSTVDLAHSLGLRVVAEGVEDVATLRLLASIGCDEVQGWVAAPALAPPALQDFVASLEDGCWAPEVAA